jgi:hypothetical protein
VEVHEWYDADTRKLDEDWVDCGCYESYGMDSDGEVRHVDETCRRLGRNE